MKYQTAFKHLTKITLSAKNARPVLQGILHDGNTLTACDSFRLLQVNIDKMNFDRHLVNPKTNEEIDLSSYPYPNVEKLTHYDKDSLGIFTFKQSDLKTLKELLKLYKAVKVDSIMIDIVGHDMTFSACKYDIVSNKPIDTLQGLTANFTIKGDADAEIEDKKSRFNLKYFTETIDFLIDTKQEDISIIIEGENKPTTIVGEDFINILMPIRLLR